MSVKYPLKGQKVFYRDGQGNVLEAVVESTISFDKYYAVMDEKGRRKLLLSSEMFTDRSDIQQVTA